MIGVASPAKSKSRAVPARRTGVERVPVPLR